MISREVVLDHGSECCVEARIATSRWFRNAQGDSEARLSGPKPITDSNNGAEHHTLTSATPTNLFVEKVSPPRHRPRQCGECGKRASCRSKDSIEGRHTWIMR